MHNNVELTPLVLVCTHLDHAFEYVRMEQLRLLRNHLQALGHQNYLLVGDFNSLSKGDYSVKQWQALSEFRKENCWEEPSTDLTDMLHKEGYRDVWRELSKNFEATCWAKTRIDYVFLSPNLQLAPVSYTRVVSFASDHFPIVADFVL